MNYCKNGGEPCCDKFNEGTNCHFLQATINDDNKYYMMNEEYQAYKDYEDDIYDSVNDNNGKYRRDMNVHGIRNGLLLYKMRMQWMHRYMKPNCYTCDNSSHDHEGNCNKLWNALRYSLYYAFQNNDRDLNIDYYNNQNYLYLNDVDDILISMEPDQRLIDSTVEEMIEWKRNERVSSTNFQVRKTKPPPRPHDWPSENDGDEYYEDDDEDEYYEDMNYGGGSIKKGTRRGGKTRCVKKHNCKNKTKRKTRCVKKHKK